MNFFFFFTHFVVTDMAEVKHHLEIIEKSAHALSRKFLSELDVPRKGCGGGKSELEKLRQWRRRIQIVRTQCTYIGEGLEREIGVHMKKAQLGRWAPYTDLELSR
jgi:hypothetical protein